MMRSDKLGYNAPIEVYDQKYYRYSDPDFSIMNMPMSENDYQVLHEAVDMLRQLDNFEQFAEMSDVVSRLQDKLAISKHNRKPIVHFDNVPNLKGLKLLNPLYNYIAQRQSLRIMYQPFSARKPQQYVVFPYLLKEFRNRWFLFCSRATDLLMFNLALDRIVSVEPIDVPYRDNPQFDSEHFFDNVIGVTKNIGNKPQHITFRATREQSHYIATKPVHPSQKLVSCNPNDGSCIFSIDVVINIEMYSIMMSFGPGVKLLSPRQAVTFMAKKLRQAAAQYDAEE